jgi:3-oxoacyl-[acyl-carrier protein] reductase
LEGSSIRISFEDRRVAIMGGSRGIGFAIAKAFATAGADVAICARGSEALSHAATQLEQLGGRVYAAGCDIADKESVNAFVREAAIALGGLDVLVNNASSSSSGNDEAAWSAAFNVDVLGAVRATEAAIPFLTRSAHGSIVSICSIRGFTGSARLPAYAAAKAALANFATSQSLALASSGVCVNAIAPGSIEFPGGNWERRKVERPDLYESTVRRIPGGRMGTAEEVANVALFLGSDLASWITGQVVVVDGGQSRS